MRVRGSQHWFILDRVELAASPAMSAMLPNAEVNSEKLAVLPRGYLTILDQPFRPQLRFDLGENPRQPVGPLVLA